MRRSLRTGGTLVWLRGSLFRVDQTRADDSNYDMSPKGSCHCGSGSYQSNRYLADPSRYLGMYTSLEKTVEV